MAIPVIRDSMSVPELVRACRELAEHVRRIDERTKDNTEGWAGNQSNVTVSRSFDADTVTTAQLADVVGTMIADLLEVGTYK